VTAWALSGALIDEVPEWDLWQTWRGLLSGRVTTRVDTWSDTGRRFREVRATERVYKRHLIYVGSRSGE
jgi:hypothetical protein